MHIQANQDAAAPSSSTMGQPPGAQDFEDFIYLISHDVRASVRALIELPQWIVEDLEEARVPITGSLATSIELMNRHTGRLDRMLVDLLTFSRIGRMQTVGPMPLGPALDAVLEALQPPRAFRLIRQIELEESEIGERDLATLLSALIQNATHHHDRDHGEICISARNEGGLPILRVTDDGPGIAPDHREKAFGAMQTLRPRDEVEGSGMGLAMVRKIAGLYGGGASIEARPEGRGTTVTVSLGRVPAPTDAH